MHNEAVAHEHGDVNFRTVLAFGIAILVVVAISSGLMYGLFVAFEKQAKARDPEVSPYAVTNDTPPRGPQLLTNEPRYLREFREEERGKLESYGWVNQGQAVAHVPIDLAKKLVVQHGLPVRRRWRGRQDARHERAGVWRVFGREDDSSSKAAGRRSGTAGEGKNR